MDPVVTFTIRTPAAERRHRQHRVIRRAAATLGIAGAILAPSPFDWQANGLAVTPAGHSTHATLHP